MRRTNVFVQRSIPFRRFQTIRIHLVLEIFFCLDLKKPQREKKNNRFANYWAYFRTFRFCVPWKRFLTLLLGLQTAKWIIIIIVFFFPSFSLIYENSIFEFSHTTKCRIQEFTILTNVKVWKGKTRNSKRERKKNNEIIYAVRPLIWFIILSFGRSIFFVCL